MKTQQRALSPRLLLEEQGILPDRRFGQNFLADGNMRAFLLRQAAITPEDVVLEIGCGMGLFTAGIAQRAGRVVAVEIDRRLAAIAREVLDPPVNVDLVECDALAQGRETLHPKVVAALRAALDRHGGTFKVLSNLPYGSAATILVALLESGLPIERILVTVQYEVARRIAARPGDRENGVLTLLVQSRAEVRILRKLPPAVFWPRPKVASAVLEIVPRPNPLVAPERYAAFKQTLQLLFRHPRKTLLNCVARSGLVPDTTQAEAFLKRYLVRPERRPGTLNIEEALSLSLGIESYTPPVLLKRR